eukprot:7391773-Prymnesium_polylepis.2
MASRLPTLRAPWLILEKKLRPRGRACDVLTIGRCSKARVRTTWHARTETDLLTSVLVCEVDAWTRRLGPVLYQLRFLRPCDLCVAPNSVAANQMCIHAEEGIAQGGHRRSLIPASKTLHKAVDGTPRLDLTGTILYLGRVVERSVQHGVVEVVVVGAAHAELRMCSI